MGELHTFTTECEDGIYYKYSFNPKMMGVTYASYLDIEKYKDDRLTETVMLSKKQIVFHDLPKDYTWMKVFKSGNEYSIMKHYTKEEGAEWKIEKKNEDRSRIINLEYDVKSSIIDKCLKLIQ